MVAIFALLLRQRWKEDINTASLGTIFYNAVLCFILGQDSLKDLGTEVCPESSGEHLNPLYARYITGIIKEELVPQILGGSSEHSLLYWENYKTSCFSGSGDDVDRRRRRLVQCSVCGLASIFTYPCPRNMGFKPAWRKQRKTFTPHVYNITNGALIPLLLNLTGIIKVKKTIFRLKESNKAFFSSLFKFSVEGKTLEMEAGHLTSSVE